MGRGHTLGKICSSGAVHKGEKKRNDGTLQASQHKLASLHPPTPGENCLSKVLLEQFPCFCQSQLDPPGHFPEASGLRVKHGNHENSFLAILGLLWVSPADDMVPPLLQSALSIQAGLGSAAGMACGALELPSAQGGPAAALDALCLGNPRQRMPKGY